MPTTVSYFEPEIHAITISKIEPEIHADIWKTAFFFRGSFHAIFTLFGT